MIDLLNWSGGDFIFILRVFLPNTNTFMYVLHTYTLSTLMCVYNLHAFMHICVML